MFVSNLHDSFYIPSSEGNNFHVPAYLP